MYISLQTSGKDYSLGIYTINTPRPFSETTHTGVCAVLINLYLRLKLKYFYFLILLFHYSTEKFRVFSFGIGCFNQKQNQPLLNSDNNYLLKTRNLKK